MDDVRIEHVESVASPDRIQKVDSGQTPRPRVLSVDALRGLTIAGMLLVNNIALDTATPAQLIHAGWNQGLHFADLIFPWFLFLAGVSIPYSESSKNKSGLWRELRLLRRAAALVLLGIVVDSSVAGRFTSGLGVLQLIGLSCFIGAALYDLPPARRMFIAAGLLVAHWAAIRFIPFPGAHPGTFTESHNLIRHINDVYLQPIGLKGLISVAPASALAIIGSLVGDMLRKRELKPLNKGLLLAAAGAVMMAAGWLWNLDLPFNKSVWTASYIMFSAGSAMAILGIFFLAFDFGGFAAPAYPLIVFGTNAISAYVLPILFKTLLLNRWMMVGPSGGLGTARDALQQLFFIHLGRVPGGWIYTLSYILFWWLPMWLLYRKRVFLRV